MSFFAYRFMRLYYYTRLFSKCQHNFMKKSRFVYIHNLALKLNLQFVKINKS
nr:MAG TPA: hypothetical protein [Caudoviricetes sp.]